MTRLKMTKIDECLVKSDEMLEICYLWAVVAKLGVVLPTLLKSRHSCVFVLHDRLKLTKIDECQVKTDEMLEEKGEHIETN